MLLTLTLACIDYDVNGKPSNGGDDGADGSTEDSAPVLDSGDTGAPSVEDCASFVVPAAAESPREATCSAVDFQGWDLVMERELTYEDGGYALFSSAIVLPLLDGAPRVVTAAASMDALIYDAGSDTMAWVDDVQNDWNGSAAATPQDRSTTLLGLANAGNAQASVTITNPTRSAWNVSSPGNAVWAFSVVDVDFDGGPEFMGDATLINADATTGEAAGNVGWSVFATPARLRTDGSVSVLGSAGIWTPASGEMIPWVGFSDGDATWNRLFQGAVVSVDGTPMILGSSGAELFLAGTDAVVTWSLPPPTGSHRMGEPLAIGDVDGDDVPEVCTFFGDRLVVVRLGGDTIWSALHEGGGYAAMGGCAMADLDADGLFEVVQWGGQGLFLRDGATGEVLASRTDISTILLWNAPTVADVDGDGSAEIVVSGEYVADGYGAQDHLWVFGAASGRFARTRPVWNSLAYDITSVRDDGLVVSFPFPAWEKYNAFRAQPAHDGERPDLVVAAPDACATSCGEDGTIRVAVQVSNLGAVEAPAGATVRLYTWTAASGLQVAAETTIPDAIPAGWAAAGVELDVPVASWGDRRVLEVVGAHDDECDWVNNREEVDLPDPCGS